MVQKSRLSKSIFHGSRKNRKPVSRGRKNIDSRITEKINPHPRLHAKQKRSFTRHEKSIGDPPQAHTYRWVFCMHGVCQLATMGFFTQMKGSAQNVCTFFNVH